MSTSNGISRIARIGEITEQIRGVSYSKNEASTEKRNGLIPILRAGNITENGLSYEDLVFVPESRVSSKQRLRANDIVIAASSIRVRLRPV